MTREELIKELDAMEAVQSRLRGILMDVAHALKGAPKGEPHDWHDLPELVEKLSIEHRHLKAWWAEHMNRVAAGYDQVAVDLESVRREAEAEGYRKGVVATIHKMQGRVRALPEPDLDDRHLPP